MGTPDSLLTTGFVPIAKISEPLGVPCSRKRQAPATIAQRMMPAEMVRTWVEPSQSSEALLTEMALPPAISTSSPCRIVAIANVMMSGGRPR